MSVVSPALLRVLGWEVPTTGNVRRNECVRAGHRPTGVDGASAGAALNPSSSSSFERPFHTFIAL